ncbi:MAG: M56 family metallopeptidase, partial [bacterium]|nr:M56 family metallopeptidase [bacterium]
MRYRDIKTAAILAGGFSVPVVAGLGVWYYGEHVRSLWLSFSSFCQQSLQLWLTVLGRDGNIAILGSWILLATGLVWGGTALLRSALLLKRSRRSLLQRTTSLANLSDPDVLVVQDERVWAMTVGLFRPRVYVSSKLAKVFSQEEFDAVIAHEKEHMKNLHPLSSFIAYVATRFLFYLPISRDLLSRLELRHELRADQAAIKKSSQAALGSAILKMHHRGAGLDMAGASGFAHLQQRVAMLVGDKQA